MDQTTTNEKEKYISRISNFCNDLISNVEGGVAKVSENFYIAIGENGQKVLKQIVPENLKSSILNKASELGIVPTKVERESEFTSVMPELATEM